MSKSLSPGAPIGAKNVERPSEEPVFIRDILEPGDNRRSVFVTAYTGTHTNGCNFYPSTFLLNAIEREEPFIYINSTGFDTTVVKHYLSDVDYDVFDLYPETRNWENFFDPTMFIQNLYSHFSEEAVGRIMQRMVSQLVEFHASQYGVGSEERKAIEAHVLEDWLAWVKQYRFRTLPKSRSASDLEQTCKLALDFWRIQTSPRAEASIRNFKQFTQKKTAIVVSLWSEEGLKTPNAGVVFAGLCAALIEAYKEPDHPEWDTHFIVDGLESLGPVAGLDQFIRDMDAVNIPCAIVRYVKDAAAAALPPNGFDEAQFEQVKRSFAVELSENGGGDAEHIHAAVGDQKECKMLNTYLHPLFTNMMALADIRESDADFIDLFTDMTEYDGSYAEYEEAMDPALRHGTAFALVPVGIGEEAQEEYAYKYGGKNRGEAHVIGKKSVKKDGTETISFDPLTFITTFRIGDCAFAPSEKARVNQYLEQRGMRFRVVLTDSSGKIIRSVPLKARLDAHGPTTPQSVWQEHDGAVSIINMPLPLTIEFTEKDYQRAKKLYDEDDDMLLVAIQTAPLQSGKYKTAAAKLLNFTF